MNINQATQILGYTPNDATLERLRRRYQERRGWIEIHGYASCVLNLSDRHWTQLECRVHEEDDLIHLDEWGFTVNHGSVGTHGISYEFT
jgi:hypothetical protein